jgi:hypothetical protein
MEMLAVGRPMAPPRPYPSHDAFSMLPLSHRSFTTPHISPLCCRPWTKNPVERDLTPGRRTVGGAPLCVCGGGGRSRMPRTRSLCIQGASRRGPGVRAAASTRSSPTARTELLVALLCAAPSSGYRGDTAPLLPASTLDSGE